jgi:hypothetical protein
LARSGQLRHCSKVVGYLGYTDRDGGLLGAAALDPKRTFFEVGSRSRLALLVVLIDKADKIAEALAGGRLLFIKALRHGV